MRSEDNSVTDPVVSVVLPAYNAERYIAASVRSILGQTFQDFELIVIDDGSADDTSPILEKLARGDSRIRLVSRENRGLVATLNEGIDLARGRWLARMDADDISLPGRFEQQLSCFETTDADIVGTDMKFFGTYDARVTAHARTDEGIKTEMLFGSPFCHPSVMMRTEAARSLKYDPGWEGAEDYDLWERAARAGWRMANVPEVLLLYRKHPLQISMSAAHRQRDLAKLVQRRWWEFMRPTLEIGDDEIRTVFEMQQRPDVSNIDAATSVFARILWRLSGDARETALRYLFRIYAMAAANHGTANKWQELCRSVGVKPTLQDRLLLHGLRMFPVSADQPRAIALKVLYAALTKRSRRAP